LSKGERSPSEHSTTRDRATGAVVHRMTSAPCINHATYFLQSSFAPDGSALLFVSYRSGSAQLYEVLPFPDGEIRQLTEGAGIHPFSPAFSPGGECVYFVRSGSIWQLRDYKDLVVYVVCGKESNRLNDQALVTRNVESHYSI